MVRRVRTGQRCGGDPGPVHPGGRRAPQSLLVELVAQTSPRWAALTGCPPEGPARLTEHEPDEEGPCAALNWVPAAVARRSRFQRSARAARGRRRARAGQQGGRRAEGSGAVLGAMSGALQELRRMKRFSFGCFFSPGAEGRPCRAGWIVLEGGPRPTLRPRRQRQRLLCWWPRLASLSAGGTAGTDSGPEGTATVVPRWRPPAPRRLCFRGWTAICLRISSPSSVASQARSPD